MSSTDPWAQKPTEKDAIRKAIDTFKNLDPADLQNFPVLKRIHELSKEFYEAQSKATSEPEGDYDVSRPLYHLIWPT